MTTMVLGARGASARPRSGRAAAAVMGSQMLVSAAEIVVLVAIIFVAPLALTGPTLFIGVGCLFLLAGVSAIVPWDRLSRHWRLVLPMLNILSIGLIHAAAPQLGSALLLVLPVIWLARACTAWETAAGVVLALAVIWVGRALDRAGPLVPGDFVTLVLLPITLVFVAATVYLAARRTRAQTVLLRQHSRLVEASLDRLDRQQQVLAEVLNTVGFGILVFNHQRQVVFVNSTYRRWLDAFGEPKDASVFRKVYRPDRVTPYPEEDRPFVRATRGREYDDVVMWVGEPGQRQAAYAASSRLLRGPRQEGMAGLVVLKDVTRELEAVRVRDELVGSVTHELRTPLTSIIGYLDLVEEAELTPEVRKHVQVASRNAERLLVIVGDLLRAASDSDRKLSFSFVRGDVASLVRDAVAAQRVLAREQGVALTLEGPRSTYADIDPVRLRQAIDNLVSNAVKYNKRGGAVAVRVAEYAVSVEIEVRDTGQGIPEADLGRVFDRFYRAASVRDSAVVGTGLGLAISREIIERHRGELTVESVFGVGSTFRITIPNERTADADDAVVEEGNA